MNFNLIKEKYPKTFDLLSKFTGNIGRVCEPIWYLEMDFNIRDLYDFFDEQEICVAVFPFFNHFIWKVHLPETMNPFIDGDRKYDSRTEAEEQAFIKAFEILEGKL